MIRIFAAGRGRDEVGAAARGGLMVSADDRVDLLRLADLVVTVLQTTPFELPQTSEPREARLLRALYGRLVVAEAEGWAVPPPPGFDRAGALLAAIASKGVGHALDGLLVTLEALHGAWPDANPAPADEQGAGDAPLRLLLGVAAPGERNDQAIAIRFRNAQARLAVWPGSVIASFVFKTAIKAARWIAIVSRVSPEAAARGPSGLVESARQRGQAASRHPAFARLDDLLPVERTALQGRDVVLVFVHGLFGTDLGTFDGLISRLQTTNLGALKAGGIAARLTGQPERRRDTHLEHIAADLAAANGQAGVYLPTASGVDVQQFIGTAVGFVGYPHNSLTGIEQNAHELAERITHTFALDGPRLIFVCHSRGGLVARAAVARLIELSTPNRDWAGLVSDVITFGTPHDGAALAETTSARDLATYLLGFASTRKLASLSSVLAYLERTAEGIENLSPAERTTESRETAYLHRLYALEATQRGADGRRRVPVLAVGGSLKGQAMGAVPRRAAFAFVTRKLGGDDEHDLVVEQRSSLATRVTPEIALSVHCDHFAYFDNVADACDGVDLAVGRIWARLLALWQARGVPPPADTITLLKQIRLVRPESKLKAEE
ncbi:MAG: hypothetical protein ABIO45_17315 [Burkholderiaceae bacterium]